MPPNTWQRTQTQGLLAGADNAVELQVDADHADWLEALRPAQPRFSRHCRRARPPRSMEDVLVLTTYGRVTGSCACGFGAKTRADCVRGSNRKLDAIAAASPWTIPWVGWYCQCGQKKQAKGLFFSPLRYPTRWSRHRTDHPGIPKMKSLPSMSPCCTPTSLTVVLVVWLASNSVTIVSAPTCTTVTSAIDAPRNWRWSSVVEKP